MSEHNKAVIRRFCRMVDGKIAEEWACVDMLTLLAQLGVRREGAPGPGPPGAGPPGAEAPGYQKEAG